MGATECCMIMYGLQFGFAMLSDTNTMNADELDLQKIFSLPFALTIYKGDLIAYSTFIMSLQYNIQNFYEGFKESKDKVHALFCTLPFW